METHQEIHQEKGAQELFRSIVHHWVVTAFETKISGIAQFIKNDWDPLELGEDQFVIQDINSYISDDPAWLRSANPNTTMSLDSLKSQLGATWNKFVLVAENIRVSLNKKLEEIKLLVKKEGTSDVVKDKMRDLEEEAGEISGMIKEELGL